MRGFEDQHPRASLDVKPALRLAVGSSFTPKTEYKVLSNLQVFLAEYPEVKQYLSVDASAADNQGDPEFVLKSRLNAFLYNIIVYAGDEIEGVDSAFEVVFNRLADELLAPTQRRLMILPIVNVNCSTTFVCDETLSIEAFTDVDVKERLQPVNDFARNGLLSSYAKIVGVYEGAKDFSAGRFPLNTLDIMRVAVRLGAGLGIRFLWAEERIDSVLSRQKTYAGGGRRVEPTALTGDRVDLDTGRLEQIQRTWIALRHSANSNTVATAARRLNYGVERERGEDAITDFVAGMESILTAGDFGEVSFKLRLRLAALIGKNADDRRLVFKNASKLYDARSALAHGREAKDSQQSIADARSYLGRLISAVLDRKNELKLNELDLAIVGGLQGASHPAPSQAT